MADDDNNLNEHDMDESYQDYLDNQEELSEEEKAKKEKEAKEKRNIINNARAAKTAIKGAANYIGGPVGGKAVDLASKTRLGQNILNGVGKTMNNVNKINPLGNLSQGLTNKAVESGAVDAVDKTIGAGEPGGEIPEAGGLQPKDNIESNNDNKSGLLNRVLGKGNDNSDNKGSNGLLGGLFGGKKEENKKDILDFSLSKGTKLKLILIFGGVFVVFLIILVIILGKDSANLDMTNSTTGGSINKSETLCSVSKEDVEKSLLFIGDSRTVQMNNYLTNTSYYIAEGSQGYNWFINTAKSEMSNLLNTNNDIKYIVIALGVNDLGNIDSYINLYNSLVSEYSNYEVYFLSVNPVDNSKSKYVNNSQIEDFNDKISNVATDHYIDTYSKLENIIYDAEGVHYDQATYQNIYNLVVEYIRVNTKTPCVGVDGEFVFYYQGDYRESYGYGTTIASSGCGPTSMAIVLTNLLHQKISPVEIANYSLSIGARIQGVGTSGGVLFPKAAQKYGINCEQVTLSNDSIISNLQSGKLMIVGMGCCTFTRGGHLMVLRGLDSDGKVLVADPNSRDKSSKSWDVNIFTREGGSIWAFSS